MKRIFKSIFFGTIFPAAGILCAVIFFFCPVSCRSSAESPECLDGDFSVAEITEFRVTGVDSLEMEFSKDVQIGSAEIFSADGETLGETCVDYGEKKASLNFSRTEIGENYVAEGNLVDSSGNSLTWSIPFLGFNSNPAKFVITEIRNAYGQKKSGGETVHRSEFVELYVLKSGNLSGFEILSASDGDKKKFAFPAAEVQAGEIITVHMRKIVSDGADGEGMISETGSDLTVSTHEDSSDGARDFWSENSSAVFADSDIVYVLDSADGKILEAVLFAKSGAEWNAKISSVAEKIPEEIWQGGKETANAVCSDNITSSAATRSFCRTNLGEVISAYKKNETLPNSGANWIVSKTATPGAENILEKYVPRTKK